MNTVLIFGLTVVALFILSVVYFNVAEELDIVDRPNNRSSHNVVAIRGGGVIFAASVLIWIGWKVFFDHEALSSYGWFVIGLIMVASVSFIDDIRSLPDKVRLVIQFIAMMLMFYQFDILHLEYWWVVILALIIGVGATNVINFMDGINGITGGYSLSILIPLAILNRTVVAVPVQTIDTYDFVHQSLIYTVIIADLVFCYFNFRPRGKAKCFAGDVGSIGIAFILLFLIGKLILKSQDPTYLIFLLVYGVDGCMTIGHRILLHENLGEAHRKHAYQLMANELKMSHITVSLFYSVLQLIISLVFIYFVPNNIVDHVIYLCCVSIALILAYVWFMVKNYHLHEEYLATLPK